MELWEYKWVFSPTYLLRLSLYSGMNTVYLQKHTTINHGYLQLEPNSAVWGKTSVLERNTRWNWLYIQNLFNRECNISLFLYLQMIFVSYMNLVLNPLMFFLLSIMFYKLQITSLPETVTHSSLIYVTAGWSC